MNTKAGFYTCTLRSLVKCYYDCQSWLRIVQTAEHDEVTADPSAVLTYGIDNCDLAPFLARQRSDHIYRLSRHDMVQNLINSSFGKPRVVVPPATLVEYVHGALAAAGKLNELLRDFDHFREQNTREFEELVWEKYEQIRRLVDTGPGVGGLGRLHDLLAEQDLLTIEQALHSRAEFREVAKSSIRADPRALALLQERRYGQYSQFSNLIDIANCETFLALDYVAGGNTRVFQMTTTGNLTLKACELSIPHSKLKDLPFRHLASPYIRSMIRQEEAGHQTRINKLQIGQLALQEVIDECEKNTQVMLVVQARFDDIDPNATTSVSKRLYDALRAWLDLIFFPYLRGIKEPDVAQQPEGSNVDAAIDWIDANRDRIDEGTKVSSHMGRELGELAGFDSDEIVERFVPDHPEAVRIIEWLRK